MNRTGRYALGIGHWAVALNIGVVCVTAMGPGPIQKGKGAVMPFPSGLIRVDAIVERELTSAGPVPVLSKDDFIVKSDDVPCPIEFFSADPAPLSVALLIDVSDSLTLASSPREFQGAMTAFITSGLGAGDRGRIGAMADAVYWMSPLTSDKSVLSKSVDNILAVGPQHGGGPSPLWDSIDAAVKMLSDEPASRRRSVIVITDGQSTGNARGSVDVAEDAAAAGVSVTTITERALTSVITYAGGADQSRMTRAMAETTGGEPYLDGFPPAPRNPARFVGAAIDALRHAYTIGVRSPTSDVKRHALEVIVKPSGLTARTRRLYRN